MTLPNTLDDIRIKVRRITKSFSPQQLSNTDIDGYVNSYYLYTMPAVLRLQSLKGNYEFITLPEQDTYDFDVDHWISVEPPAYIAGFEALYSQSQEEFYRLYPKVNEIDNSASVGTGITGPYSFTLQNTNVLKNSVVISFVDAGGNGQSVQDDGSGTLVGDGTGSISYTTGAVTVTFNNLVPSGNNIMATYVPYTPSRPQSILFYNNQFVLRPVPDAGYKVEISAFYMPTELIAANSTPELKNWWEMIAVGAALKVFTDRRETEQFNEYMPIYKRLEMEAINRTVQQQTNQRANTIYTQNNNYNANNFYNQY